MLIRAFSKARQGYTGTLIAIVRTIFVVLWMAYPETLIGFKIQPTGPKSRFQLFEINSGISSVDETGLLTTFLFERTFLICLIPWKLFPDTN